MISVLTTKRNGISYLENTLRYIDESAKENRFVLLDGIEDINLPQKWELIKAPKPERIKQNQNKWTAWKAFSLAVSMKEDLIFFEDDIELCKNAARYIEIFNVPEDVNLVSFYAPYSDYMPSGLWRAKMTVYNYAQAMKFPYQSCKTLAEVEYYIQNDMFGGFDEALQYVGKKLNWTYAIHYPGIVQHIGAKSIVGNGSLENLHRTSRVYKGRDFNAMTLRESMYK